MRNNKKHIKSQRELGLPSVYLEYILLRQSVGSALSEPLRCVLCVSHNVPGGLRRDAGLVERQRHQRSLCLAFVPPQASASRTQKIFVAEHDCKKKHAMGIARLTQKRNSRHMPAGSEPVAASPGAEGATAVFTRSRTPDTPRKLVDFVAANFASFVDCASTRHVQPMEKRQNSRVARRSHISQNTGLLRCHDSSKLCSDRSPSHRRLA